LKRKGGGLMEIENHPILHFKREGKVQFTFDGRIIEAYRDEPIAMALFRNGCVCVFRKH